MKRHKEPDYVKYGLAYRRLLINVIVGAINDALSDDKSKKLSAKEWVAQASKSMSRPSSSGIASSAGGCSCDSSDSVKVRP